MPRQMGYLSGEPALYDRLTGREHATGRTGASRGIPALVAAVAYMTNGLAPMVSWLKPFQKFSPFYQYGGHDRLRNGISGSGVFGAVLTVAGLVAIAIWAVRRRDVLA